MPQIGYCTNVHPGRNLSEVQQQLARFAVPVRQLRTVARLPIGLWLPHTAAAELDERASRDFGQWLDGQGLVPYTINAFPFHNFHQEVVKHQVYLPTWAESARLDYTLLLARRLAQWLPEGQPAATISTLPVGWPGQPKRKTESGTEYGAGDRQTMAKAGQQLIQLAQLLAGLEASSGKSIQVCLEPEPGCLIDTAPEMVAFFKEHLFTGEVPEALIRRHLGVCHDVCHSAVMFEPQRQALESYQRAGIVVGKVQVSAAVEACLLGNSADQEVLQQLAAFNETKYLHQTVIRPDGPGAAAGTRLFEDLPEALQRQGSESAPSTWRVHFHVPIFQQRLGRLATTQSAIVDCVTALEELGLPQPQWEVETYAWGVLPAEHADRSLEAGIAAELRWFEETLRASNGSRPTNTSGA